MLILGTPKAAVTVTLAVLVQPLMGFVAVTVYVPAVVIVTGFAELGARVPPFQISVLPTLTAVRVLLLTVQLRLPVLEAVIPGAVVLDTTVTVSSAVQLLDGSVTTSV